MGAWVPLARQQNQPPLTRRLAAVRVCVPLPEHRATRQDVLRSFAALVRKAVGDAYDAAAAPDEVWLERVLLNVLPEHLEPLANQLLVESWCLGWGGAGWDRILGWGGVGWVGGMGWGGVGWVGGIRWDRIGSDGVEWGGWDGVG